MKSFIYISLLTLIVTLSFSGCTNSKAITELECTEKGFVSENKKILNYRSGKYIMKTVCVKNK